MAEYITKVLIIGSGPAGYSAGIYAARAGLNPVIVSGFPRGGQLMLTPDIENFPGFPKPVSGSELMQRMHDQAMNVNATLVEDRITEVDASKRPFVCYSENQNVYTADSIIVATGANANWLNLESEQKFLGYGVSGCATCDGFFYKNKDVAVIGGGNTALEEALFLANITQSVTIIHRRDSLRGVQALQQRLFNNPKIKIIWDTVVDEVLGTENPLSVTGLRLKNIKHDTISELKIDGVFISIGHHPNSELFKNILDINPNGYIITKPGTSLTSVEGIFAAGDVQDPIYRQAIIAASSGCIAALEAEKYLNDGHL